MGGLGCLVAAFGVAQGEDSRQNTKLGRNGGVAMRLKTMALGAALLSCVAPRDGVVLTRDANGVEVATWSAGALDRLPWLATDQAIELRPQERPDSSGFFRISGGALMPDGSVVIASNGTLTLEQYDPLGAFMRAYGCLLYTSRCV